MKTNSSPSPGGNTARTSTFDALNGFFARAKPALQCPPINDAPTPMPPSMPPPSNAPSDLPATSSPSAPEGLRFDGVTANASGKPSGLECLRLPWWWTLIAIIASFATAPLLTFKGNGQPTNIEARPTAQVSPPYSLHRVRDGSGWIVALPNQGMYLLTVGSDGMLLVQTQNGLEPIRPLTDPIR